MTPDRDRAALARRFRRTGSATSRSQGASGQDVSLPSHLQTLFAMLGVDCVLDVGANRGQFAQMIRSEVGFTGRMVSYEPVSSTFAELCDSWAADPHWEGRQVALGRESALAAINVFPEDRLSSFLTLSSYGVDLAGELGVDIGGSAPVTEVVTVRTLAEEWSSATAGSSTTFLKLDCQGRDLDVLHGAGDVLPQIAGLIMEVPAQRIYDGVRSFGETMTAVLDLGFEITGFWPEHRDLDLRVIEFDCVLRRS
jgi:FkbM family methyltransferase